MSYRVKELTETATWLESGKRSTAEDTAQIVNMLPNEPQADGMWEFSAAFTAFLLRRQHEEIHLIQWTTQVFEINNKNK